MHSLGYVGEIKSFIADLNYLVVTFSSDNLPQLS